MPYNEKDRFYERIESRVGLDEDLRAGLRDAILKNQTLKALVYIELLFEELDKGTTETPKTVTKAEPVKKVDSKPKRTTTAKTKTTTEPKSDEESGEKKDDEAQS